MLRLPPPPERRGYKAWVRLRVGLGLILFPIVGNLIRLYTENAVKSLDEREGNVAASAYPAVIANLVGCFIMGAMYELRGVFEDNLPGVLAFPDVPDAPSVYVAITTWLCGSITTYSSWNSVVAKRTIEQSVCYGFFTALIGAATSYMALLMGMDVASGFTRVSLLDSAPADKADGKKEGEDEEEEEEEIRQFVIAEPAPSTSSEGPAGVPTLAGGASSERGGGGGGGGSASTLSLRRRTGSARFGSYVSARDSPAPPELCAEGRSLLPEEMEGGVLVELNNAQRFAAAQARREREAEAYEEAAAAAAAAAAASGQPPVPGSAERSTSSTSTGSAGAKMVPPIFGPLPEQLAGSPGGLIQARRSRSTLRGEASPDRRSQQRGKHESGATVDVEAAAASASEKTLDGSTPPKPAALARPPSTAEGGDEFYSMLVFVTPGQRQLIILTEIAVYLAAVALLLAFAGVAIHKHETVKQDPLWLSCLFAPIGAAMRYLIALRMARTPKLRPILRQFPLQTFTANIIGATASAILIVAVGVTKGRGQLTAAHYLDAVSKGFCGCISTYSTFALELHKLPTRDAWRYALATFLTAQAICLLVFASENWDTW